MTDAHSQSSVGIVEPKSALFDEPLFLRSGEVLEAYTLVYETYGELNADGSNAVLICHALSGNHHAAGYHSEADTKPGWWDTMIGPGKPIDTNRLFVVSSNNIGGCDGSTGPSSISQSTGKPWGSILSPILFKTLLDGPMNLNLFVSIISANISDSDKKP